MAEVIAVDSLLPDAVETILRLGAGDSEPVIEAMEEHAAATDFPIVGANVGRLLRVAATMVDAERVFEFGSGFGYSAVWFAGALPADGDLHLTDYDATNLDRATEFLERAGYADLATFHAGDAMTAFEETTGSFDVVLIDHEKARYVEAFELAVDRVTDGGIIIADNMMAGPTEPEHVARALSGEKPVDETTEGIAAYVHRVREDPRFETALVPLGEGISISVFRPE